MEMGAIPGRGLEGFSGVVSMGLKPGGEVEDTDGSTGRDRGERPG